ncbi:trafficking protein particle complex subunit 12 [Octopus bimaculoides]|uniref:trafficking protein particle complex subunit 12 n=1 Tax=Octopus bimaculoides TaxID=37653 RepID=UPI00071E1E06|nr:trafficking protein particle complex subunit 12 [Octopus bimaculoides]|eukprot:XP_014781998.1 PREDICTED: trafficking protein particle complex subunit 12-like [Octopus bimaculoides]
MDQSVCLDDDDDDIISDIVNTAHLNIDQDPLSSTLVHSPTTDTLDSVMLEPSPSEDGSEEQDGEELAKSTSVSPIPDDTSLQDLESDAVEAAAAAATTTATAAAADDVVEVTPAVDDEEVIPQVEPQDQQDIMITITSPTTLDTAAASSSEDEKKSPGEEVHQEPESVTFEGTESVLEENCNAQEKEDFLLDDEEFESFTAEESQIGFELGLTSSPKQVLPENYSHSTDHTPHERERHVSSSSSKTPLSSEVVRENSMNQFFSEVSPSLAEEPDVPLSPAVNTSPAVPKLVATENVIVQAAVSSHGTPVHQSQHISSAGLSSVPFQQFIEDVNTDDLFTMGLDMSDSDRRHDAWVPVESTQKMLNEVASAQEKPEYSSEMLSTPGITVEEAQPDPIQEMLRKFMGDDEADLRQTMSADAVSQDTDGLCKLVKNECFRAAVEMTGRLLVAAKQGPDNIGQVTLHTPHTLQIWFCRIALLLKVSQRSVNLSRSSHYFSIFRGSMVPFGLRLLDAQLPFYLGHNKDAVDKLYYILSVVQQIISNLESGLSEDGSSVELSPESKKASLELWSKRQCQVMYIIANILLSIKDYVAALDVYQELLKKDVDSQSALLTGIGRIFLQMGDIGTAESYFKKSEDLNSGIKRSAAKTALNKGLVALCTSNFHEAFQHFKAAVVEDPSNPVAVNNMAVSSLYLGKLKDALDTLEDLVQSDPTHNLHEGILFNLCTLYELESSHAPQKKQALLSLVSKHKGDSFHVACLKMS